MSPKLFENLLRLLSWLLGYSTKAAAKETKAAVEDETERKLTEKFGAR